MQEFKIVPQIFQLETAKEFLENFQIGKNDLVFTSKFIYDKYFVDQMEGAHVLFSEDYLSGEPSDETVEAIHEDIKEVVYTRVFGIGGGTILDLSKLIALKQYMPIWDLFEGSIPREKDKELILLPTTCGTGSEVTKISILEFKKRNTKMGMADDVLFPEYAVLVPELMSTLPYSVFATSSIDALIHATESYTSPLANAFTKMYSKEAIRIILSGYKSLAKKEIEYTSLFKDFLLASIYGGIAFGNAGCAAVHAMSYPIGANYHVPHGEANYSVFTQVYKTYQSISYGGSLKELYEYLASIFGCEELEAFAYMDDLLENIIHKRPLHEYGLTPEDVETFTDTVMTKQGRLMKNNYVELSSDVVKAIYTELL